MSNPDDHVRVSPDLLRAVARDILDLADLAGQHARFLGGAQDSLNDAPRGLDSARAVMDVEIGWQRALSALNTKVAVDADVMSLNAVSYADTEQRVVGSMRVN